MYLAEIIHDISKLYPNDERYGLTGQIRRCAVSIPSNIAEGYCRSTSKDYARFLHIAYGSAAELETQLLLSKKFGYINSQQFQCCESVLIEILTPKP